jgi:hypothetical protein
MKMASFDIIFISSYWGLYFCLVYHPNPNIRLHPRAKQDLQLFGYYIIAICMTRHYIQLIDQVREHIIMNEN